MSDFIKVAIKDFKTVAALTPTSRFARAKIVSELKEDHKFVVEYGAGDGIITKEILKKLPPDGRLVAIELNETFINHLQKIQDERLTIIKGNVVAICKDLSQLGLPRIDAVISGIPFSYLPSEKRKEIIENTYAALAKTGVFIVYQHTPFILSKLKLCFRNVCWFFEPRNLFPYFIMIAEK